MPVPTELHAFFNNLVENSRNAHNTCEVDDLRADLESEEPPLLIDVRSAEAYANRHVTGALNIPVAELGARRGELPEQREHPIVTVCTRGNQSISGMLVLQSLGYRNVRSLNGGTIAWADQGLSTDG